MDKLGALTISKSSFTMASLIAWMPAAFYWANLYRMSKHSGIPYIACLAVFGTFGLIKIIKDNGRGWQSILIALGVFLATGICNYLFVGNVSLADVASDMLLIGLVVVMFAYPMSYFQGVVSFYTSISFFVVAFLQGRTPLLLLDSSRNYISILLVLFCCVYYISLDNSKREFRLHDLIPAFLCFLLAIWAYGRGGILVCAVQLGLLTAYYCTIISNERIGRKYIICLALFIIVMLIIAAGINPLQVFMNLGRWKDKGTYGDDRFFIWTSYFTKAIEAPRYFFFGAPLEQIPIVHRFNGNTHNSFIQLHALNGLLAFVMFVIATIKSIVYGISNKRYLYLIIMATIVIRGMTDKFIFGQYGMPVMMYLVLVPFMEQINNLQLSYEE